MAALTIWGADWGLPSVDPACIELMTIINIGEFPIEISSTATYASIVSQTGDNVPPNLSVDKESYHGREGILDYFREEKYSIDEWLTQSQLTECITMKSFIKSNLQPYVEYMIWLNSANYTSFTRKTYSKLCRFPSNYYIPNNIYRKIKDKLELLHNCEDHEELGNALFSDATECLNLFSSFLDDKLFLFGDRPSSLDAMLFSYLAIISNSPVQSDRLQNHMVACENFDKFIGRIKQKYHKKEATKDKDEKIAATEQDQDENKDWIFPSIVAVTAMVSYAIHVGLLHIRHAN